MAYSTNEVTRYLQAINTESTDFIVFEEDLRYLTEENLVRQIPLLRTYAACPLIETILWPFLLTTSVERNIYGGFLIFLNEENFKPGTPFAKFLKHYTIIDLAPHSSPEKRLLDRLSKKLEEMSSFQFITFNSKYVPVPKTGDQKNDFLAILRKLAPLQNFQHDLLTTSPKKRAALSIAERTRSSTKRFALNNELGEYYTPRNINQLNMIGWQALSRIDEKKAMNIAIFPVMTRDKFLESKKKLTQSTLGEYSHFDPEIYHLYPGDYLGKPLWKFRLIIFPLIIATHPIPSFPPKNYYAMVVLLRLGEAKDEIWRYDFYYHNKLPPEIRQDWLRHTIFQDFDSQFKRFEIKSKLCDLKDMRTPICIAPIVNPVDSGLYVCADIEHLLYHLLAGGQPSAWPTLLNPFQVRETHQSYLNSRKIYTPPLPNGTYAVLPLSEPSQDSD